MRDAVIAVRIEAAGHIVEVDKGIVRDDVRKAIRQRANVAADTLFVGFPRNAGVRKTPDEVAGHILVVDARRVVGHNTQASPGLQVYVIRQVGVDAQAVVVALGVGSDRKQRPVDVGRVRVALD